MTDLIAPLGAGPHAVQRAADVEAPQHAPVLITAKQVLFATAAAVPLQPTKTGRRWIDTVRAALLAAFVVSSNEKRSKQHPRPPRADFLEDARMAREMTRL
jgi:hypothetical protein